MAYGIDFGTSNSVVARCESDRAAEVIEVDAVDAAWRGIGFERVFPSVISAEEDGFLYGWAAKFSEGERLDAVKRMLESEERLWIGGQVFAATTMAAAILAELKRRCRRAGQQVQDAVLSIPSNATGPQRYRTMLAAQRAGIRPIRLINEPTAAALAFMAKLPAAERSGSYLVFDWGGGTLDVTVLEHADGVNQEVTSHGIRRIGGVDFDARFRELVSAKLGAGVRLTEQHRQELERKKIALSSESRVNVTAGGRNAAVTRSEFEASCQDLIDAAMDRVSEVLADYGPPIDWLVLVGGTSQIPAVREALDQRLAQYHSSIGLPEGEWTRDILPASEFDPMTAVAEGAAIAAAIATGEITDEQLHLTMANDMGVVARNPDTDLDHFSCLIQRRTYIPFRSTRRYRLLSESSIKIRVVEGSSDQPLDHDDNVELASLVVPVPESLRRANNPRFTVEFTYDENALMHVKVEWLEPKVVLFDGDVNLADGVFSDESPVEELHRLQKRPSGSTPPPVKVRTLTEELGFSEDDVKSLASDISMEPTKASTIIDANTADLIRKITQQDHSATITLIVDGSNVSSEVSDRDAGNQMSYMRLVEAVDQFCGEHLRGEEVERFVIVDANFPYLIGDSEKAAVAAARRAREVHLPPARAQGRADGLILRTAEKKLMSGDVVILTNDQYLEFKGDHPWLYDSRRLPAGSQGVPKFFGVTLVGGDIVFTPRVFSDPARALKPPVPPRRQSPQRPGLAGSDHRPQGSDGSHWWSGE